MHGKLREYNLTPLFGKIMVIYIKCSKKGVKNNCMQIYRIIEDKTMKDSMNAVCYFITFSSIIPTKRKKVKLYMVEKSELPTLYRCFKTATTYIFILFLFGCYILYITKKKKEIYSKSSRKSSQYKNCEWKKKEKYQSQEFIGLINVTLKPLVVYYFQMKNFDQSRENLQFGSQIMQEFYQRGKGSHGF